MRTESGSMPTSIPVSRAYTNLTGSGDLKLLRSTQLKYALADYYAAAQLTALVQSAHEMELVQTFQPYIIDNLDYAAVKPLDRVDGSVQDACEDKSFLKLFYRWERVHVFQLHLIDELEEIVQENMRALNLQTAAAAEGDD